MQMQMLIPQIVVMQQKHKKMQIKLKIQTIQRWLTILPNQLLPSQAQMTMKMMLLKMQQRKCTQKNMKKENNHRN